MKTTSKLPNGIEIGRLENPSGIQNLPTSLYTGVEKKWSDALIYIPAELLEQLQSLVSQYLRIMGLDAGLYPARVDLGLSESGRLIIYEITTGFVDQVGSLLALQEMLGEDISGEIIQDTPFDASFLSSHAYKPEYELMRGYFSQYQKPLEDTLSGEKVFLYGYPDEQMRGMNNLYPSWRGLEAEQKDTQVRILEIISKGTDFIVPRFFENRTTLYDDLPEEKNTKLLFKQIMPKLKGERNSILFGKGTVARSRYEFGEMLAQEYIPPFRDGDGQRFEMKALFLPNPTGTKLLGLYNLTDEVPSANNFGSTRIPNDGYPQGAVKLIQ